MEKNRQTLSEAEIELLKEALKRSYKERFEMATRLYKIQQTMSKASVVQTLYQQIIRGCI
jgi:acyl-[acyl carrier protein]--UDP-N-acetylglucosamine O-acyltransferase